MFREGQRGEVVRDTAVIFRLISFQTISPLREDEMEGNDNYSLHAVDQAGKNADRKKFSNKEKCRLFLSYFRTPHLWRFYEIFHNASGRERLRGLDLQHDRLRGLHKMTSG